MNDRLDRWLALFLLLLLSPSLLLAQDPEPERVGGPPVLQWLIAVVCVALVLLVVCMPSKKS